VKKSTKIWLGIATIWPIVYMFLFFVMIFGFMFLIPFAQRRSGPELQNIDLIQLEQKIKNGEVARLLITRGEITATDRVGGAQFHASVSNERTKAEIIRLAREIDANGKPRVDKIEENEGPERCTPTIVPVGFMGFFAVHMFTILLMMALMVFYIIHVVKTDRLDQNMRIIWVVLMCTMAMFAAPVYWYLYIWREPPTASFAPAQTSPDTP